MGYPISLPGQTCSATAAIGYWAGYRFGVWLVPLLIRRWQNRLKVRQTEDPPLSARRRRFASLRPLVSPVVGLILSLLAIWYFGRQGFPNGLLDNSLIIFWYWLVYRILIIILNARFGDVAKPYLRWVLTPVFAYLVFSQILDSVFGLTALGNIVLIGGVGISRRPNIKMKERRVA